MLCTSVLKPESVVPEFSGKPSLGCQSDKFDRRFKNLIDFNQDGKLRQICTHLTYISHQVIYLETFAIGVQKDRQI